MKNLKYGERQFQIALLRAQWWLASVTSGHYKQRQIFHGTGGPELTDEEKLAAAMATANRHLEFATDCSEASAVTEEDAHKQSCNDGFCLCREA